jgi:hypothetical protein
MSRYLRTGSLALALLLAIFWAKVMWEFGTMAEPEHSKWDQAILSLGFGLVLQLGLVRLPWAVTRGNGTRILVGILMLPAGLIMLGSLWGAIARVLNGNPMELWVNAIYVVGSAGYVAAYAFLITTKRPAAATTTLAAS